MTQASERTYLDADKTAWIEHDRGTNRISLVINNVVLFGITVGGALAPGALGTAIDADKMLQITVGTTSYWLPMFDDNDA